MSLGSTHSIANNVGQGSDILNGSAREQFGKIFCFNKD